MVITKKEIDRVCSLARLELSSSERDEFTCQIDSILGYVAKINELDTSDILPTSHPIPLTNVMREDEIGESLQIEDVMFNAPDAGRGYFRVPKIIE
ncbi:MAG: Asp-tRNA(Asn)/Glu-tRNA(Gln) amidotransferase subunit GatC [bacterium]|nr:Asp-tRNA(Asn)/Glu-tRNA(Gln) amidotransferase subunit GatC [bacterium]